MHVFRSLDEVRLSHPQALTVGVFDGVHRGHQYLIARSVATAAARGAGVTILTFWPPPVAVLRPEETPHVLMTGEEKIDALASLPGIDQIISLPFTTALAALSAEEFLRQIRERMPLSAMVEGEDFTLGHHREGTMDWLSAYGEAEGIHIERVTRQASDGAPISSTRIRGLLDEGDVAEARLLLGRPFALSGVVVHGDARGRTLGYPTANLAIDPLKRIPANGIYAVRCWRESTPDQVWLGAASIGVRPVFNGTERRVEVYILDIDLDLYDETLHVAFFHRLREEQHFATIDALIAQMGRDVAETRRLLSQPETGMGL